MGPTKLAKSPHIKTEYTRPKPIEGLHTYISPRQPKHYTQITPKTLF